MKLLLLSILCFSLTAFAQSPSGSPSPMDFKECFIDSTTRTTFVCVVPEIEASGAKALIAIWSTEADVDCFRSNASVINDEFLRLHNSANMTTGIFRFPRTRDWASLNHVSTGLMFLSPLKSPEHDRTEVFSMALKLCK